MKTQELIEFLQTQDAEIEWVFEKKDTKKGRTLLQNSMWWKLFGEISKHLGYNVYEVKGYLLAGTFGTKKLKLHRTEIEVPVISRTRDLTKEQGIHFIEVILKFMKIKQVPSKVTSRELDSFNKSYNL